VRADELLAYIAGVVAHPGFTAEFGEELATPGVRVPITKERTLWDKAVKLGRTSVWLQTYGARFADEEAGRPLGDIRAGLADELRPLCKEPVKAMPHSFVFNEEDNTIVLYDSAGVRSGVWGPVTRAVFDYTVGNLNVIGSWLNYRKDYAECQVILSVEGRACEAVAHAGAVYPRTHYLASPPASSDSSHAVTSARK